MSPEPSLNPRTIPPRHHRHRPPRRRHLRGSSDPPSTTWPRRAAGPVSPHASTRSPPKRRASSRLPLTSTASNLSSAPPCTAAGHTIRPSLRPRGSRRGRPCHRPDPSCHPPAGRATNTAGSPTTTSGARCAARAGGCRPNTTGRPWFPPRRASRCRGSIRARHVKRVCAPPPPRSAAHSPSASRSPPRDHGEQTVLPRQDSCRREHYRCGNALPIVRSIDTGVAIGPRRDRAPPPQDAVTTAAFAARILPQSMHHAGTSPRAGSSHVSDVTFVRRTHDQRFRSDIPIG